MPTAPPPNQTATNPLWEWSLARILGMIRLRISHDLLLLGLGGAIILGINLLAMQFFSDHRALFNYGHAHWTATIGLGSYFFASTAFRDMQSRRSGTDWLLIPASPLEKYLAACFEFFIVLPVSAMVLATVLSALLAGIQNLAGGSGGTLWTPLAIDAEAWRNIPLGIVLFLTGSSIFRKHVLLKSLGLAVAWYLTVWILSIPVSLMIAARVLKMQRPSVVFQLGFGTLKLSSESDSSRIFTFIAYTWNVLYFIVTPLCALAFGYFRVREKEAKDAVT